MRSPHAQTIAGVFLPGVRTNLPARRHEAVLDDGDRVVLHDDQPASWTPGSRIALLVHGLGGSHQSGYMQRLAVKLAARGIRTFRMDQRGWGAGFSLARRPFHGARWPDLGAAIEKIGQICPASPTTLVGFSLGGNMALNLLAELGESGCGGLDSAAIVCPPLDVLACSRRLTEPRSWVYNRHFVRMLLRQYARRLREGLADETLRIPGRPKTVFEFDSMYTAAAGGFADVHAYYQAASALAALERIRRHTLLIRAEDDPLAGYTPLERSGRSVASTVELLTTRHGGHMGFLGRAGTDADCRWLDWRIVDWVTNHKSHGM